MLPSTAVRAGTAHVVTTRRTYKGRVYQTYLLRCRYREGGTVKNETLGNLSHLPEPLIEIIRRALRSETFVAAGDAFEVLGPRAHDHVQAVHAAMHRLDVASLLGAKPSPERTRVLAMLAARIIAPHTQLATTRWRHTTRLAEEFGVANANENDLYAAMDWLLERGSAESRRSSPCATARKGASCSTTCPRATSRAPPVR